MKRNIIILIVITVLTAMLVSNVVAQSDDPDYDLKGRVTSGGSVVEANGYRLSSVVGVPSALAGGDYTLNTSSFLPVSAVSDTPDEYEPRGYLPVVLSGYLGPPPRN